MAAKTYGRTALTGGASGALDEYDADNLNDGDRCMTVLSTGVYYIHRLDASSGAAESSPDVVKPDSGGGVSPYAGDKRWILSSTGSLVISDLTASKPVFTDANKKLVSTGTLAVDQGGTGAANASDARTALGLAIGTNVLAQQTIGIADNNLLEVDDAAAADEDIAVFTADGIEGVPATGTGSPVRATSPTLVTPLLGTPTSGTLTGCDAGTATAKGVLELATDAEAKTGTDTARAVTPANLRAAVSGATTVTTTYTSLITDSVIYGNHATTGFTITLLAAATAGVNKRYTIANINAALVTVDGNSAETVGGLPQQCIGQNEAITIDCDGSNWHIVHDARVKSSKNELTNSLLSVWSNSEDLYDAGTGAVPVVTGDNTALVAGGSLVTNGGFDSATTGWTATDSSLASDNCGGAGGQTNNGLTITNSGASYGVASQAVTVEIGKLYEASVWFKKGTATYGFFRIGSGPGLTEYADSGGITDATWTQHTLLFEASTTTVYISVENSNQNNATGFFDTVTLHEVTPGIVSAATTGPDGWQKTGTADIWRQHNDATYTQDGSFYSLKFTAGQTHATNEYMVWPETSTGKEWLAKFKNRTVTLGCWVYAETGTFKIGFYDSAFRQSDANTLNNTWEWMEYTITVNSALTNFQVLLFNLTDTKTAYISQPMLVFGSSIGEGNYVAPVGEVVWLEDNLNIISNATLVATTATVLNTEVLSNGKIPKSAVMMTIARFGGVNSAASQWTSLYRDLGAGHTQMALKSQVAAVPASVSGNIYLTDGDCSYYASNGGWTECVISVSAVQVS